MPISQLTIRSYTGNEILIEPADITANRGLEYSRLIIPVKLNLNPIKEYDNRDLSFDLINLRAELFLEDKHLKVSDLVFGFFPYSVKQPKLNITYRLEFPLDYKRIMKIEEYRRHNLSIQIHFNFTTAIYDYNTVNSFENCYSQLKVDIEQSHWIKNILPSLSFGEYFLIEIPRGDELIEKAWAYIENADVCYGQWDTKGAFANCREMGNLLDKIVKEKLSSNPNIVKWDRSYSKFNHFVSLFLHVEDVKGNKPDGDIVVNKNDTEHILINSKALLKYAEYLLRESI
jgi:hypothetical protein